MDGEGDLEEKEIGSLRYVGKPQNEQRWWTELTHSKWTNRDKVEYSVQLKSVMK